MHLGRVMADFDADIGSIFVILEKKKSWGRQGKMERRGGERGRRLVSVRIHCRNILAGGPT